MPKPRRKPSDALPSAEAEFLRGGSSKAETASSKESEAGDVSVGSTPPPRVIRESMSARVDETLIHRVRRLSVERKEQRADCATSQEIVEAALREYLDRHGA